jgi:hypothetical protein
MFKLCKLMTSSIAVLTLAGCDTFFIIDASVVDSVTGTPVPKATATLVLDKGFSEPDQVIESADDGTIRMAMNEPAEAWATLTVEKQGYVTWSTQFQGRSGFPFVIYLVPE